VTGEKKKWETVDDWDNETWIIDLLNDVRSELLDVRPNVVAERTALSLDDIMAIRNKTMVEPDFLTINVLQGYLIRNGEQ
jgi:hypothetical protein